MRNISIFNLRENYQPIFVRFEEIEILFTQSFWAPIKYFL